MCSKKELALLFFFLPDSRASSLRRLFKYFHPLGDADGAERRTALKSADLTLAEESASE